eukprot:CAMPEP_0168168258 /NCGR_PEP_ID=MMETSP0139_2-20121125/2991_1 /TAXON_ID=44445 /ORGANISM="Pseudo-nitzschia australis, Strain 10249 10 AB" /LENGTH=449 /DNA_ID=CAMNT_0008085563 /DNA_START=592 /DNA_END=1945 /DNA_ORIENTATION=-
MALSHIPDRDVLIYTAASWGKLGVSSWQDGSAIYRLTYGDEDYPGIFNPDFIFGRYGPLKLLCWSSLFLESVCYITVWVPALRKLSVVLMIFLHIGIDLSMQMHMFEWLSCLGWCIFLIQPESATTGVDADTDGNDHIGTDSEKGTETDQPTVKETEASPEPDYNTKMPSGVTFFKKALSNIFIVSFIILITIDTGPYDSFKEFLPKPLRRPWIRFMKKREHVSDHLEHIVGRFGLSQDGEWSMYTNVDAVITSYRIDALLQNWTQGINVWRTPDWSAMPIWKRKLYSRRICYYSSVHEDRDALLHLIKVVTKPFIEEGNSVHFLSFISEDRLHKEHEMESTGGFWDPVVKHPMDIMSESEVMFVGVDGNDFKVVRFAEIESDDERYDGGDKINEIYDYDDDDGVVVDDNLDEYEDGDDYDDDDDEDEDEDEDGDDHGDKDEDEDEDEL